MAHKKLNLPTKICIVCNLPFTWRKKWQKNWEEVKYCSERCRNKKAIGNYELSDNKKFQPAFAGFFVAKNYHKEHKSG